MDNRITSVILESVNRPDYGRIAFSLYDSGTFILEAMDGWSGISSINTDVEPYQLRNGSDVSSPNRIGGKIVNFLVHITGKNETQTIKNINALNALLQNQVTLKVVDDGIEFMLDRCSMTQGSYKLTRKSPTYYVMEFGLAASSAYRTRTEQFERVISAGGQIISGGIIYPLFTPLDDVVSYPDFDNPYVTITSLQEGRIVIEGNGEVFPMFYIVGTFQTVTITFVDALGKKRTIELTSDASSYHEWWINNETLEVGFTTPNVTGANNFDDTPQIVAADWFQLSVGQNVISAKFDDGGRGTVKVKWQEKYL